jgi:hypothetical protein
MAGGVNALALLRQGRRGRGVHRGRALHGATPVILTPNNQIVDEQTAKRFGIAGERFHSQAEARHYRDVLLVRQRAGEIRELRRQVRIPLHAWTPRGPEKVGVYVADFVFVDVTSGREVVQDKKGNPRREDLYDWKRRHMAAEHGIEIEEV